MEEGYIGEIRGFAGNFAPQNWAYCQGQILQIQQYGALYSILGTIYGGDGKTTFQLPNLQGRAPIGAGTGPETGPIAWGVVYGKKQATLTLPNMPIHTHSATLPSITVAGTASGTITPKCAADEGDKTTPVENAMAAVNNGYVGTGDATSNMAPISASLPVTGTVSGGTVTVGNTGASQGFDILQPSVGINWIICLLGYYPPRPD